MTACNITPVKILIVDDHGLVREGLQAILSRSELGAQYVEAWDAASLWSQLQQHAPQKNSLNADIVQQLFQYCHEYESLL